MLKSQAARRPTVPALAVCVWTTSGASLNTSRVTSMSDCKSVNRLTQCSRDFTFKVRMPAACAASSSDASPTSSVPKTSSVSCPLALRPALTSVTWRAGPPTFRRAIIRRTFTCLCKCPSGGFAAVADPSEAGADGYVLEACPLEHSHDFIGVVAFLDWRRESIELIVVEHRKWILRVDKEWPLSVARDPERRQRSIGEYNPNP